MYLAHQDLGNNSASPVHVQQDRETLIHTAPDSDLEQDMHSEVSAAASTESDRTQVADTESYHHRHNNSMRVFDVWHLFDCLLEFISAC